MVSDLHRRPEGECFIAYMYLLGMVYTHTCILFNNRVTPYSTNEYGAINLKVGLVENSSSEDSASSTTSVVPQILAVRQSIYSNVQYI